MTISEIITRICICIVLGVHGSEDCIPYGWFKYTVNIGGGRRKEGGEGRQAGSVARKKRRRFTSPVFLRLFPVVSSSSPSSAAGRAEITQGSQINRSGADSCSLARSPSKLVRRIKIPSHNGESCHICNGVCRNYIIGMFYTMKNSFFRRVRCGGISLVEINAGIPFPGIDFDEIIIFSHPKGRCQK